jgi:galactoside O-acetyltransferase
MGFKSIGTNVKISRFARFYRPETIIIGSNTRIDDFCFISGADGTDGTNDKLVIIGSNVHIATHCGIWGNNGLRIGNFTGISSGCKIYTASDNFSGDYLFGPQIPVKYTDVTGTEVNIGDYCIVGAGSTIFPGITIKEGCAIGAHTLVNKDCDEWGIYAGIPIKFLKPRSNKLLDLVDDCLSDIKFRNHLNELGIFEDQMRPPDKKSGEKE